MNEFHSQLDQSIEDALDPYWEKIYRLKFAPDFIRMEYHGSDMAMQKAGIDRSIWLTGGRRVGLDEKVRYTVYDDILLEAYTVYDDGTVTEGWVSKPTMADIIAYRFKPSGECHFFNTLDLHAVWAMFNKDIQSRFFHARAENMTDGRHWVTHSWCVDIGYLEECMRMVNRIKG